MNNNVPVYTADQDRHIGARDAERKGAKLGVMPQGELGGRGVGAAHVPRRAGEVVCGQGAKDGKDEDLQDDAGDDGAVATLEQLGVRVAGGGGDAAPDGLDDEAREVGGQEEARVPMRRDAREPRVEVQRGVLERQVDGHADEGGREDDGADLQLKGGLVPRVVVEEDAPDVACLNDGW